MPPKSKRKQRATPFGGIGAEEIDPSQPPMVPPPMVPNNEAAAAAPEPMLPANISPLGRIPGGPSGAPPPPPPPPPPGGPPPQPPPAEPNDHPEYRKAPQYDPNGDFASNCMPITIEYLLSRRDDDSSSSEEEGDGVPPTKFLFLFVLGITRPKVDGGAVRHTAFRTGAKKGKLAAAYKCKYTFASLHDKAPHTCVVLEANNTQHNLFWLWDKSLTNIRVGIKIAIQSPRIVGFLPTGSPIIETDQPFLVMTQPSIRSNQLIGNTADHTMKYFILKNWRVDYSKEHMPVVWKTICNSDVCDRLQFGANPNVTCGCFGQNSKNDTSSRNCILKFDMKFRDSTGTRIRIKNFTSLQTSRIFFQNRNIIGDYDSLSLSINKRALHAKFKNAMKHINDNGGWTLVGWHIRGEIDDDAKEEADESKLSENLRYNLSHMQPSTFRVERFPADCVFGQADLHTNIPDGFAANVLDNV